MLKKSIQPNQAQLRQKRIIEKQIKIKGLVQQIQKSKLRQTDLIQQIGKERRQVQQRDNSLADPSPFSAVDLDIRNSQLISSVQIERKRWLQAQQKEIFEILGEEQQLKSKMQQLLLEQKPMQKSKLIKMMKRKLQMLQALTKIKPDSGLYISHQRVILKQFLQDIRQMNGQLQSSNKHFQTVESQYNKAETKLKNTINDLKMIVQREASS